MSEVFPPPQTPGEANVKIVLAVRIHASDSTPQKVWKYDIASSPLKALSESESYVRWRFVYSSKWLKNFKRFRVEVESLGFLAWAPAIPRSPRSKISRLNVFVVLNFGTSDIVNGSSIASQHIIALQTR